MPWVIFLTASRTNATMGIGICPLNGLPDGHAFPVPAPGKRPKEKIQTVYLKMQTA